MRNITLCRVRVKSSAPVSPLSLRPSPAVVRCFNIDHSSVRRKPRGPVTASARCQRGAKSRSRVRLADLPQGGIALEPLPRDEDRPTYPTVVQQARSNMTKFENCVLLTRVGSFYEVRLPGYTSGAC
jgi:hypothetical protein